MRLEDESRWRQIYNDTWVACQRHEGWDPSRRAVVVGFEVSIGDRRSLYHEVTIDGARITMDYIELEAIYCRRELARHASRIADKRLRHGLPAR